MTTMRRIFAGASAALSAAVLAGCMSGAAEDVVHFDALYPTFATNAELTAAADVVVRGSVVKSRVDRMFPNVSKDEDPVANPQAGLTDEEVRKWREDAAIVVTIATVRVAEVLKGNVTVGSTVEVSQLGGMFEGVLHVEKDTTMMAAESDYLMFLSEYGAGKPHGLVNSDQAVYAVNADGSLAPTGDGASSLDIKDITSVKSIVASAK